MPGSAQRYFARVLTPPRGASPFLSPLLGGTGVLAAAQGPTSWARRSDCLHKMAAPTPAGQQMGPGCLAAVFSSSYLPRAEGSNLKSLCHQSSLPPQPQVSPCQVEPPGGFSPPNLLPSKSFLCTEPGSLGRVGLAARPGSLGPPLRGGSGDKQPREWGGPRPLALQPRLHRARHQSLRSQRRWHRVSIRAQVEMPPVSQLTPKNQGSRAGRRTPSSQLLCSQHSQQHPKLGRGCLLTLTAQQTPQATPHITGAFPRSHSPAVRAATESQFLTVLEARSLRRRCWQGWLASSGVSPAASSSFFLCLHIPGASSGAQLFPFLLKTTDWMRSHPCRPHLTLTTS